MGIKGNAEMVVSHLRGLKYDAELIEGGILVRTAKKMRPGQVARLRNELRAVGFRGKLVRRVKT